MKTKKKEPWTQSLGQFVVALSILVVVGVVFGFALSLGTNLGPTQKVCLDVERDSYDYVTQIQIVACRN